jgi:hypothetical protein
LTNAFQIRGVCDDGFIGRFLVRKIIFFLTVAAMSLLAQDYTSNRESYKQYFQNIQGLQTIEHSSSNAAGGCSPQCQKLSNEAIALGYRNVITDFNAQTGITTCAIFNYQNGIQTGYSSNTKNEACIRFTNTKPDSMKGNLTSLAFQERLNTNAGDITFNKQVGDYTKLSTFIVSMMTLDPEMIDFRDTDITGLLSFKDPSTSLMAIDYQRSTNESGVISATVAENLNKANLGYYSNLFHSMGEVYGYLQNLLFVFIGMFFVGKIGFDKGLRALDKSKESQAEANWVGKFYIPVIAVGFFFAPIPEDAGMNATVVQKMIRFMALESTNIADRAASIGTNVYMRKLHATVGTVSAEGEAVMLATKINSTNQETIYANALDVTCKIRYPYVGSFLKATNQDAINHDRLDANQVVGNNNKLDVTFDACRVIEYRYQVSQDAKKKSEDYIAKMKAAYGDSGIIDLLAKVNESLQQQQDRLGWPNAFMVPGMSILVESLPLVTQITGDNGNSFEQALSDTIDSEALQKLSKELNDLQGRGDGNNATDIGYMVGRLVYMTLPGAKGIYETLKNNKDEAILLSGALDTKMKGKRKDVLEKGYANEKTYLEAMAGFYEWIIDRLPVAICVIAGIIAFIGYIIELAKYFYISPFVVAFALTTKKTHKIIDFLVTGIAIFFKPILLVIFIFFSMFVYTLIQDVFLHYAIDQFSMLSRLSGGNEMLSATAEILKHMLKILGSLGSTYIMWKIILTGPTWAMKLVGMDGAQNDMISEALSQRMDRAAFRM